MTDALIIDDSAFMRHHLTDILQDNNLATKIIKDVNGLDAIHSYIKYKPDIVTMDFDMPEFDGIKTTERILQYDKNAKIIMTSSTENDAVIDDAIKSGVSAFVKKPYQAFEIKEAFEFVLAQPCAINSE